MTSGIDWSNLLEKAFCQYLESGNKPRCLPFTGHCHYCETRTKAHFCCTACRDAWEKQKCFGKPMEN